MDSSRDLNFWQGIRTTAWLGFRFLLAGSALFLLLGLIYFGLGANYTFQWGKALNFLSWYNEGLIVTLQLALFGTIIAVFLGLIVALGRISRWAPIRDLAGVYVHTFRNLPFPAVLLLFFFGLNQVFSLPTIHLFGQTYRPPFVWGVLALGVYEASYLAETFRAGIQSVKKAQTEAAQSLGMNGFQVMRYVVLPQAFRVILPPMTSTIVALIKETALLYLITVPELTYVAAKRLAGAALSRPYPFEFYIILAGYYLSIVIPLSLLSHWLESRMGISKSRRLGGHT